MGILFPLGIGFLGFGAYEYSQYGFTEHVGILFFMGALNMIYTLFKFARNS
jgi:hypothetical protein